MRPFMDFINITFVSRKKQKQNKKKTSFPEWSAHTCSYSPPGRVKSSALGVSQFIGKSKSRGFEKEREQGFWDLAGTNQSEEMTWLWNTTEIGNEKQCLPFKENARKLSTEGGGLEQVPEQLPGIWKWQGKHRDKSQRVKAGDCKIQGDSENTEELEACSLIFHPRPCKITLKAVKGSFQFPLGCVLFPKHVDLLHNRTVREAHPRKQAVLWRWGSPETRLADVKHLLTHVWCSLPRICLFAAYFPRTPSS